MQKNDTQSARQETSRSQGKGRAVIEKGENHQSAKGTGHDNPLFEAGKTIYPLKTPVARRFMRNNQGLMVGRPEYDSPTKSESSQRIGSSSGINQTFKRNHRIIGLHVSDSNERPFRSDLRHVSRHIHSIMGPLS